MCKAEARHGAVSAEAIAFLIARQYLAIVQHSRLLFMREADRVSAKRSARFCRSQVPLLRVITDGYVERFQLCNPAALDAYVEFIAIRVCLQTVLRRR